MYEKYNLETIRFVINSHNKQEIELRLHSDENLKKIAWNLVQVELKIDLNYIAFNSIEQLNISIFNWLNHVVHLHLKIINVSEQKISKENNGNFFKSLLLQLNKYNKLKSLKITIPQVNIFQFLDFKYFNNIENLTVLDLSELSIHQEKYDYLNPFVDLIKNVNENCILKHILLPNNLKQIVFNLESEHELFTAIYDALSKCKTLVEIEPLPIFNQLNLALRTIIGKKQGSDLEKIYFQYDEEYETIKQLQSIKNPTPELKKIINTKSKISEIYLKKIVKLLPMVDFILPENIYWLEKILREKLNDPQYSLKCLQAIKHQHQGETYLFKILQGIINDLIVGQITETDPDHEQLTTFKLAHGSNNQYDLLKTIFKLNLLFKLHQDEDLAKLISNLTEEFVYGSIQVGKYYNDKHKLLPPDQLGNIHLVLCKLLYLIKTTYTAPNLIALVKEEMIHRNQLASQSLEQQNNLILNYFHSKAIQWQEVANRQQILTTETQTRLELNHQQLTQQILLNQKYYLC